MSRARVARAMTTPPERTRAAPSDPPRTVVLDTAALLAGTGPGGAGATVGGAGPEWLCPPAVRAEVRPGGATGRAIERAESAGLRVVAPTAEALARVTAVARESGDLGALSGADVEVVALAWERAQAGTTELWSDDYAVMNVARRLGVNVRGVTRTGGGEARIWHVRCTGCGRYPDTPPEKPCPVCGSPLKRTRRAPRANER